MTSLEISRSDSQRDKFKINFICSFLKKNFYKRNLRIIERKNLKFKILDVLKIDKKKSS